MMARASPFVLGISSSGGFAAVGCMSWFRLGTGAFVLDTGREELELGASLSGCSEERGYPPYLPMMVALLRYAYGRGVLFVALDRASLRGAGRTFHGGHMNQLDFRTNRQVSAAR